MGLPVELYEQIMVYLPRAERFRFALVTGNLEVIEAALSPVRAKQLTPLEFPMVLQDAKCLLECDSACASYIVTKILAQIAEKDSGDALAMRLQAAIYFYKKFPQALDEIVANSECVEALNGLFMHEDCCDSSGMQRFSVLNLTDAPEEIIKVVDGKYPGFHQTMEERTHMRLAWLFAEIELRFLAAREIPTIT
ncbi:MAG: hypothetical protein P1U53_15195, partial [Sulfitobacter sp.]|nr:hypothetical protein [Sulfitobacter sp.]